MRDVIDGLKTSYIIISMIGGENRSQADGPMQPMGSGLDLVRFVYG